MSWFKDLMNRGKSASDTAKLEQSKPFQAAPQSQKERSSKVSVDLINSEHLFYDLLFGKEAESLEIENNLETKIVEAVGDLLINPDSMTLEPFPKALKDALQKIDSGAPIDQVELSLQQDPIMATQVVKLANSAAFRRTDQEVNSLKMAINFIGLDSLKQVVTAASLGGLMKVSPIYFKLFGEKVWQHSITTAKYCEEAAKDQGLDPYAAFFVGLIHDIGKIAVFKALVEAMQQSMPGIQPGSIHFRKMMSSMSKQLTVNIVKQWNLPQAIVLPLQQHMAYKAMAEPCALTKILVQSKLLSEVSLLLEAKLINELDSELILIKNNIKPELLILTNQA